MKLALPRRIRRRQVLATLAGMALIGTSTAQTRYPSKSIRLIVPFSTGGSGSFIAREVGHYLSRRLNASVVVDNRPGANGNIGATAVARAEPDGYTLLAPSSSITLSPSLFDDPGFVLERDLAPVAMAASIPFGLFVNAAVPVDDFQGFVQWLTAQQGSASATYASAGSGNLTFLSMYLLLQHLGLKATHVPYSGAAPALIDVLRGEPPFMINDLQSTREFVKTGKLKLLAVTSRNRSSVAPHVPTFGESGVPGFDATGWIGMFAPAETPPEIVERLNAELRAIAAEPDFRSKLLSQGTEPPQSQSVQEFGAFVTAETKRWGDIIRASGVKIG